MCAQHTHSTKLAAHTASRLPASQRFGKHASSLHGGRRPRYFQTPCSHTDGAQAYCNKAQVCRRLRNPITCTDCLPQHTYQASVTTIAHVTMYRTNSSQRTKPKHQGRHAPPLTVVVLPGACVLPTVGRDLGWGSSTKIYTALTQGRYAVTYSHTRQLCQAACCCRLNMACRQQSTGHQSQDDATTAPLSQTRLTLQQPLHCNLYREQQGVAAAWSTGRKIHSILCAAHVPSLQPSSNRRSHATRVPYCLDRARAHDCCHGCRGRSSNMQHIVK
jgi:hypothetical protein